MQKAQYVVLKSSAEHFMNCLKLFQIAIESNKNLSCDDESLEVMHGFVCAKEMIESLEGYFS